MNIFEVSEHTRTNESAIQFLQDRGILRSLAPQCPNCHNLMNKIKYDEKGDGYMWQCNRRHELDGLNIPRCKSKQGARSGSFLEQQKIEPNKFIMLAYLWAHGVSGATQESMVEFGHPSVVQWNQYFRDVCSRNLLDNPIRLGGPGHVVQIGTFTNVLFFCHFRSF